MTERQPEMSSGRRPRAICSRLCWRQCTGTRGTHAHIQKLALAVLASCAACEVENQAWVATEGIFQAVLASIRGHAGAAEVQKCALEAMCKTWSLWTTRRKV